ncbi:BglG family transcription antiterminator [Solobacterium moorei]|uniref:BglG family transcription antiterminator n=1 Tax=Solobacterium moorei TaxID=102148 RepID=UPI00048848DA|nr:PTS sugar transporter subunit IIA [Solobacterium moorei]
MYDLKDRERQIVFYLYSKPNTSANTISAIFNVSDKTIRNDIKSINKIVGVPLIVSTNQGFLVNEQYYDLITQIPLTSNTYNEQNEIIYYLLSEEKNNIFELAEKINLSENTLILHLNNLKELLSRYNLSIERKNNDITINGLSSRKRQIYIDKLIDEAGTSFQDINIFQKYFDNVEIETVKQEVISILNKYNYGISKFYFNHFLLNLCVILNFDFNDNIKCSTIINNNVLKIAKDIDSTLNTSDMPRINEIYSTLCGVLNVNEDALDSLEDEVKQITSKVFNDFSIDIDITDFLHIFSRHINDMITRCKNNNPVNYDGGLSIKESCFFIYDVAVAIAKEISEKHNIFINEQEISLIAMHIGFLIENSIDSEVEENKIKIGLIAGLYIDKQNLIDKINKCVPHQTDVIVIDDLNNQSDLSLDFTISINFSEASSSLPNCHITPLFTRTDKLKLIDFSNRIMAMKKNNLFKKLFKLYFNEKNFFCDTCLDNSEDVIKFLTAELERQDIVNSEFCSSVLVREAIASTNIGNMYAIPHAMEFTANRTSMSIYINPKGIRWNDSEVKIVFLSAINKKNIKNLRLIYDFIIDTVSDQKKYSKLIQCKSISQFEEALFEFVF